MAADLSLSNPVMKDFVFYMTVVMLKMLFIPLMVVYQRNTKWVFTNPEDLKIAPECAKVQRDFEPVERVRRNHLNDLENIVPFVLVGLCYVLCAPAPSMARFLFRLFAGSRIFHTLAYQLPLPAPSRSLAFIVGFTVIAYMTVMVLFTVM